MSPMYERLEASAFEPPCPSHISENRSQSQPAQRTQSPTAVPKIEQLFHRETMPQPSNKLFKKMSVASVQAQDSLVRGWWPESCDYLFEQPCMMRLNISAIFICFSIIGIVVCRQVIT